MFLIPFRIHIQFLIWYAPFFSLVCYFCFLVEVNINNDVYETHADTWHTDGGSLNLITLINPPRFHYFYNLLREKFPSKKPRILDVGCGGGILTNEIASAGFETMGNLHTFLPKKKLKIEMIQVLSYFSPLKSYCHFCDKFTTVTLLWSRKSHIFWHLV